MLKGRLLAAASQPNVPPPPTAVSAINFDGSTYLLRGGNLTGISDSSTGIISVWVNLAAAGNSTNIGIMRDSNAVVQIRRNGSNVFTFQVGNGLGTGVLAQDTTTTYTGGPAWYHLLLSWNTNFASGSKILNFYINGVAATGSVTDTGSAFTTPYSSVTDWGVGAVAGGSQQFQGCISEMYFAPGQFLDFTVSTNRDKFISGGAPVNLGSNGSIPTGTAPEIYLHTYSPASAFNINSGTGGNFATTGTLTTCGSTPVPVFNSTRFTSASSQALNLSSALTGASNSGIGIMSFWFKPVTTTGTQSLLTSFINGSVPYLVITYNNGGTIGFQVGTDSSNQFYIITGTTLTDTTQWYNVLMRWSISAAAGSRVLTIYINGTLSSNTIVTDTGTSALTVAYSSLTAWQFGSTANSSYLNGIVSEVYFAPGQTLDFSIQTNREKFILAGAPVNLGADGSLPTGTAPKVYFKNAFTSFGNNSGTGGNFTIVNAPLTDGGGAPHV